MNNELAAPEDLKKSEALHLKFEQALAVRQEAQPELDQLQARVEDSFARMQAAKKSQSDRMHIDALKSAHALCKAQRDKATAEAETPYVAARDAVKAHDGRFCSAASGWADSFRTRYSYDESLTEFVFEFRRKLEEMQKALAPLESISKLFDEARDRVENWQLCEAPKASLGSGHQYLTVMQIPRLSDWLR